ncbi:MAG: hypothetical protein ACUVV0_01115 [Anaerolineae bacterium]
MAYRPLEAATWQIALRKERLNQLQKLSNAELTQIVEEIRACRTLPRMRYHFEKHGFFLGVSTPEEYLALLHQHLSREDLRFFTHLRRREKDKMWYLVAIDTGTIAQYNESRQSLWSFYRSGNVKKLLLISRGWWIEVRQKPEGWQILEDWEL